MKKPAYTLSETKDPQSIKYKELAKLSEFKSQFDGMEQKER